MGYTLEEFCADLRAAVGARGLDALPAVAANLHRLLTNPDFVAAAFNEQMAPGKYQLAHDEVTGAYVLAHVQPPSRAGAPHTHGDSWAVYGTARGATAMTEYRRVDDGNPEGTALAVAERYTLGPGDTRAYHSGAIHSTAHAEPTWVVRVTGTDLDRLPRYRFDRTRDRLVDAPAPVA
jgi:hypothetical protein